jgi:hypothetical protein
MFIVHAGLRQRPGDMVAYMQGPPVEPQLDLHRVLLRVHPHVVMKPL